ncbi:MAG: hypothetical protein JOY62_06245 [Acidobacteriaceae bacterium]|nr:hypothetical protein [Acidobacteriaceae bacterium]MBV9779558.1 hypothetical protein [Acidobacteriaceae bacterium]
MLNAYNGHQTPCALVIEAAFSETFVLKANGALGEPPGLGHFVNQKLFGLSGGRVLFEEGVLERVEIGGVFARDDQSAAGETMLEGITRRSQFSGGASRAGRALGVLAVGGESGGGDGGCSAG